MVGAALEERIEQLGDVVVIGPLRAVLRRIARHLPDDAELDEFREAVVHVHPQAAERRHQGFDLEQFLRAGAQKAEQPGAQRRLDQVSETGLQVARRVRTSHGGRTPGKSKGQIVHGKRHRVGLLVIGNNRPKL